MFTLPEHHAHDASNKELRRSRQRYRDTSITFAGVAGLLMVILTGVLLGCHNLVCQFGESANAKKQALRTTKTVDRPPESFQMTTKL